MPQFPVLVVACCMSHPGNQRRSVQPYQILDSELSPAASWNFGRILYTSIFCDALSSQLPSLTSYIFSCGSNSGNGSVGGLVGWLVRVIVKKYSSFNDMMDFLERKTLKDIERH